MIGVVLHHSAMAALAAGEPGALLAVDDADADARPILVPMLSYSSAYREHGRDQRGGELLDMLLDVGVVVDAPLDRSAARAVALIGTPDLSLSDAEAAWHARRRGWPVRATAEHADRLAHALPDLHVVPV